MNAEILRRKGSGAFPVPDGDEVGSYLNELSPCPYLTGYGSIIPVHGKKSLAVYEFPIGGIFQSHAPWGDEREADVVVLIDHIVGSLCGRDASDQ